MSPKSRGDRPLNLPLPGKIGGRVGKLTDPIITAECRRVLEFVRVRCPELLPAKPVKAGTVVGVVQLHVDEAARLFAPAAALAAGVDRPGADATAPVVWREGDRELLVRPAGVTAKFASGVVVVAVPVFCDQVGEAQVFVTFVVGDPGRPAGLLAATESRPRGPAEVVDAWGDSLVAFAWHVLLEVASNIAGEAGRDLDGSRLVPIALAADGSGLHVTPMARHSFDRSRG